MGATNFVPIKISKYDEYKSFVDKNSYSPTILLFSSKDCKRCQPVKEVFNTMLNSHQFTFLEADAHSEHDFDEEFEIKSLPAVVIQGRKSTLPIFINAASAEQVKDIMQNMCIPHLKLDADF